jgi:hypothetical protein
MLRRDGQAYFVGLLLAAAVYHVKDDDSEQSEIHHYVVPRQAESQYICHNNPRCF